MDNKPVVHLLYAPLAASRAHAITQGKYERGRVGLLSGPSAIGLELWLGRMIGYFPRKGGIGGNVRGEPLGLSSRRLSGLPQGHSPRA